MTTSTHARRFLSALEPVAAAPWFSPDFFDEMKQAGFEGWRAYFCSRAAPLGTIPADAGIALFYGWEPELVRRELWWDPQTPAQAWDAFLRGADRTLRRLLGDADVSEIVPILRDAVAACPRPGRALFAAYAQQPEPSAPMLSVWQSAMTLREFRGDTHNAVLVSHGIGPVEAHVLNASFMSADVIRYLEWRGWKPSDAEPAFAELRKRAFLDDGNVLTEGGAKFREMVEMDTDRRSGEPFDAIGSERVDRAVELLGPLGKAIHEAKGVPSLLKRIGGAQRG